MTTNPAVISALDRLRLDGAIFLRGEYTEPWAYESPTGEMMASVLRPGRENLLFFHIIANGRCWLTIDDGAKHWAEAGDVVVIPYGHQHKMGGERTDVICGYLDVDDPLFDPALAALPEIFVVRPTGAAKPFVESSLRYVLEATETGERDAEILTRLPALVLAEVLRIHVESAPAADRGFAVARRVGYEAEEAFSRAFKRAYGLAPTHWRAA